MCQYAVHCHPWQMILNEWKFIICVFFLQLNTTKSVSLLLYQVIYIFFNLIIIFVNEFIWMFVHNWYQLLGGKLFRGGYYVGRLRSVGEGLPLRRCLTRREYLILSERLGGRKWFMSEEEPVALMKAKALIAHWTFTISSESVPKKVNDR